jgi:hypothetical protein
MQNASIEERQMAKSGGNRKKNGEPASTKFLGWRIFCGALVVSLGLAAVVLSLHLVLDSYDVKETPSATVAAKGTTPTATSDTASVSAASAVAVLTPVMAGIIGLAGLYFGISATASARGRQAAAEETKAESKETEH